MINSAFLTGKLVESAIFDLKKKFMYTMRAP
ncbi:hypothetical protein DFP96_103252 [Listeria rocourtiae]|uniref:Uncharacterized protein n=1 Tax=Listeria rocourtiae TaxID=647910 RepID=A0A4R6ZP51_9LIST|nr:hypothetical protein DFP96_103252 [Listeria rocourtiae]